MSILSSFVWISDFSSQSHSNVDEFDSATSSINYFETSESACMNETIGLIGVQVLSHSD